MSRAKKRRVKRAIDPAGHLMSDSALKAVGAGREYITAQAPGADVERKLFHALALALAMRAVRLRIDDVTTMRLVKRDLDLLRDWMRTYEPGAPPPAEPPGSADPWEEAPL